MSAFGVALGVVVVSACAPLPGSSLDPVYLKLGTRAAQESAQTATRPATAAPFPESKGTGTSLWIGRYRDSRGDGEVMVSVVRAEAALSGIWKLRTGGGGPFKATGGPAGRRLTFRMENTAPECPGIFEGWLEIGEETMIGAYHGRDCEGVVSDGRLDLRLK